MSDRGGFSGRGGNRGPGGTRGGGSALRKEVKAFRQANTALYSSSLYILTSLTYSDPNSPLTSPDAGVKKIEDAFMANSKGLGKMSTVSLDSALPLRPAYGTQGRQLSVYANYFKMNIPADLRLIRYSISVVPEAKGKKMAHVVGLLLERPEFVNLNTRFATDFKSFLVASQPLTNMPDQWDIRYRPEGYEEAGENARVFHVKLQEPEIFSVSSLINYLSSPNVSDKFNEKDENSIIQSLNVIIGHHAQSRSEIATISGNKHFSMLREPKIDNIRPLGDGLEAYRGFVRSTRPVTGGILLNVNVTHAVFFEPINLALLYRKMGTQNLVRLKEKLKGMRIQAIHLPQKLMKSTGKPVPRIKTIQGLATPLDGAKDEHPPEVMGFGAGPQRVRFWVAEEKVSREADSRSKPPEHPLLSNTYISVYDYFQKKYPAIKLNPINPVVNVGNTEFPNYLPAEVCQVLPGNKVNRRLSPGQTQQMIKMACRAPYENAESLVGEGKSLLGLGSTENSISTQFGLNISKGLLVVNARRLPPPSIIYRSSQVFVANGSWNMSRQKFHKDSDLGIWSFVIFKPPPSDSGIRFEENQIRQSVLAFKEFLTANGINAKGFVPTGAVIDLVGGENSSQINTDTINLLFSRMIQSTKIPRFLLCIVPVDDPALYNGIKTVGDTRAGIQTVCVVGSKFSNPRGQSQYFANIALKFNLKAGGINHALEPQKLGIVSEGETMVVGLDVTHPSPGSKIGTPSSVAMVASIDRVLAQWPADFRIQLGRQEIVSDVEGLLLGRLELWFKFNKKYPKNILMYRDGVSEGQYDLVLKEEMPGIRKACKQLYSGEETRQGLPHISVIICGKRHNTRFFPTTLAGTDRASNCFPGTVVDRGITLSRKWDFFMQPHSCLQGTARPCHYFVILDEIFRNRVAKPPSKNAADSIEDLTHNMCHLFQRATKAVSLCPPAYYADLLCTRLRCYQSENYEPSESVNNSDYPATPSTVITPEIHSRLRDSMYYI
ncbi:Protein argonaute 1 [Golovinomyces cichoracearum]|uniref:Protein argonaute 1 n=1 Tax=Golovinomyces cichoracearum TaxID=62708 RepID=A0A420IID0_9PEZI|nr:Protein argonaute 1 [Golovinomyces cichoracearum]